MHMGRMCSKNTANVLIQVDLTNCVHKLKGAICSRAATPDDLTTKHKPGVGENERLCEEHMLNLNLAKAKVEVIVANQQLANAKQGLKDAVTKAESKVTSFKEELA